ncbi:MAG: right-handed parallel beta-helix repeat-containing protein [Alkalispirochaeta sp.]
MSTPPGMYSDSVSVRPQGTQELEYRFLDQSGAPHTSYYLPLTDGVELHAPRNAEIRYVMEIRRVGLSDTAIVGHFVLDTLAPAAPRLTPLPALYTAPITLTPETVHRPELGSAVVRVAMRIANDDDSPFTPIPSEGTRLLGVPGTVRDYRIHAFAVDALGNRSSVTTSRYRIDRSGEAPPAARPLISPHAGTYANEQILLLDDTGLSDISVVLSTPEGDRIPLNYRETPRVRGAGEFTLSIEATVRASGKPYLRDVTWRQSVMEGVPDQGRSTAPVRLHPPTTRVRYKLEDRPVAPGDPFWLRIAELTPPPDGTRPVVVRYREDAATHDTRLAFLLDGRRAPRPEIARASASATMTVYSLAQTELQWAPSMGSNAQSFSDPIVGNLNIDLGSVSTEDIVVRARFPGGPWTQRTVSVDADHRTSVGDQGPISDDGVTISVGSPGTVGDFTLEEVPSGTEFLRFHGRYPFRWRPPPGVSLTLRQGRDESRPVEVIRTPLAPPDVSIRDGRLTVSGEGQIFYRIDGSRDAVYDAPVELSGVPDARRRYRIDAYRIVDGRISPTVTRYWVVDQRQPIVPEASVVPARERTPGEFLSRAEETTVRFSSPYDDLELYYEVATDGQALLPHDASPRVADEISLTAPEGSERRWAIRVRGRFRGQTRWSPVYQLSVIVDRRPPAPPQLTTDPRDSGILAFEAPAEQETTVWYRLRPSDPYRIYQGPVTVDRDRLESALTISAYTRDGAGNRTHLANPPVVEPLNQEPAPPNLTLNGRVITEPRVVLSREAVLEALDPDGVRWRIINAASQETQEGNDRFFRPIDEPRVLADGTYRINAYRERGAERSRVIERLVTIDSHRPRSPEHPHISYAPDGRSGTAYWPGAESELIFASLVTDSESDHTNEPFSISEGILRWTFPDGVSRMSLVYFSVGESGRRSETEVIQLEEARVRPPAEISGVRSGERYNNDRTVRFDGYGDIRFTITVDGSSPGPVRVSSPLYDTPLTASAAAGETARYRLRYRTFDGDRPVSEEREISFVIDREPPQVPDLRGASPDGYYSELRTVRLHPNSATDEIMYRIATESAPSTGFSRYTGEELVLAEDRSAPRRYRVEAYSVDQAGNRSSGIATWEITIDATSLHVSETDGDDALGDGSRENPLASLDVALQRIAETSRNTIFLAAGDYSVSAAGFVEEMNGDTELTMIGGYDSARWLAGSGDTSITFRDPSPLRLQGRVRLEHLSFSQPLHMGTPETPDQFELRHVEIGTDGTPGIVLFGGTLSLFDSFVTPGLEMRNGATLDVRGSSLGTAHIHGGVATISDSLTTGARISGSARVAVIDSRISDDRSVNLGGLVYVESSALEIQSSLVQSTAEDPILVRGRDADIRINGAVLSGVGDRSVIAVRAHGGQLTVSNSVIDVHSDGYGYGIFLRDSPADITGSAIVVRSAGDGIAVATGNGALSIHDSVLWLSEMDTARPITATGVSSHGQGVNDVLIGIQIRNSVILAPAAARPSSAAVRLSSNGTARIVANRFGGWPNALIRGTSALEWERAGQLPSVGALNQSRFGDDNRDGSHSAPPDRGTPTIPERPIPAELIDLREATAQ